MRVNSLIIMECRQVICATGCAVCGKAGKRGGGWSLLRLVAMMMTIWMVVVKQVEGHGRLMDPPARNSMWRLGFDNPVNYNDNELYCGGRMVQWLRNGGQCGVCGDAYHGQREHEAGGKFANGIITRTYRQGDVMPITVHLTANHQGWFEIRLCPVNDAKKVVTQECLDRHVLQRADVGGSQYPVQKGKYNAFFNYTVQLPPDLTCSQCVVQWKYRTGNTWDKDDNSGVFCLGCGPQEEFYNCADISIVPDKQAKSKLARKKELKAANQPAHNSGSTGPETRSDSKVKLEKVKKEKTTEGKKEDDGGKIQKQSRQGGSWDNMVGEDKGKIQKQSRQGGSWDNMVGEDKGKIQKQSRQGGSWDNMVGEDKGKSADGADHKQTRPREDKYSWRAAGSVLRWGIVPIRAAPAQAKVKPIAVPRQLVVKLRPTAVPRQPVIKLKPTAAPTRQSVVKVKPTAALRQVSTTTRSRSPFSPPPNAKPRRRYSSSHTWSQDRRLRTFSTRRPTRRPWPRITTIATTTPTPNRRRPLARTGRGHARSASGRVRKGSKMANWLITVSSSSNGRRAHAGQQQQQDQRTTSQRTTTLQPDRPQNNLQRAHMARQRANTQRTDTQAVITQKANSQRTIAPARRAMSIEKRRELFRQKLWQHLRKSRDRQKGVTASKPQTSVTTARPDSTVLTVSITPSCNTTTRTWSVGRKSTPDTSRPLPSSPANDVQAPGSDSPGYPRFFDGQEVTRRSQPRRQQFHSQSSNQAVRATRMDEEGIGRQGSPVSQPTQPHRSQTSDTSFGRSMNSPWWRDYSGQSWEQVPRRIGRTSTVQSLQCRSTVQLGGGMDDWCTVNCNANYCPAGMCMCQRLQDPYPPSYDVVQPSAWAQPFQPTAYNNQLSPVHQQMPINSRIGQESFSGQSVFQPSSESIYGQSRPVRSPFAATYSPILPTRQQREDGDFSSGRGASSGRGISNGRGIYSRQEIFRGQQEDRSRETMNDVPSGWGQRWKRTYDDWRGDRRGWGRQRRPFDRDVPTTGWNRQAANERQEAGWNRQPANSWQEAGWSRQPTNGRQEVGWNRQAGKDRQEVGWNRQPTNDRQEAGWNSSSGPSYGTDNRLRRWGMENRVCRATGLYSGLPHYDSWCRNNCAQSMCPMLMCTCAPF